MSQKRQKPKRRKANGGRPRQKIHKINGRNTHQEMVKHITMLQAQGKLSEAIGNGELGEDTIPDLIQETVSGIYKMTTSILCVRELLKEGTIKLIPNFSTLSDNWDREIIRFEENANAYLLLKEQQVKHVEADASIEDEDKIAEMRDDSAIADIMWDLVDGINTLFLKHATDIADLTQRYATYIDEYIKDHVLENETPNDYAVRICQAHIESIREKYATKLEGDAETAATEVISELISGEPANV